MKKLSLILFLFFYKSIFACFNETRVLLNGKIIDTYEESLVPHGNNYYQNKEEYQEELTNLYHSWLTDKNINDYSDYGVISAYLGEYKKALKVYEEIESLSKFLIIFYGC